MNDWWQTAIIVFVVLLVVLLCVGVIAYQDWPEWPPENIDDDDL